MKLINSLTGVIAILSFGASALAQGTPAQDQNLDSSTKQREQQIQQRKKDFQKQLDQSQLSGRISGADALKLEKKENRVRELERKALADGKITDREMKKIEKAQDYASRDLEKLTSQKK